MGPATLSAYSPFVLIEVGDKSRAAGYNSKMQSNPSHLSVQFLTVDSESSGQRLDNFLIRHLKGLPKSYLYKLIRKGEIRVNKKRPKPFLKIQLGDQVRVPPLRLSAPKPLVHTSQKGDWLAQAIVFENDELIVLNKPSNLAVHGGSGISFGVIELLRQMRPDAPFLELAHRLDRETSGCLLVAKRRSALLDIQQQLLEGTLKKRYLALVTGQWPNQKKVSAPLLKMTLKSGERRVRVDPIGKAALTEFKVAQHYANATLLEVSLLTGRTHQIRVHTRFVGHPILGDEKYGHHQANQDIAQMGLNRLFLHAHQLEMRLPNSQTPFKIESPLDPHLSTFLMQLTPK